MDISEYKKQPQVIELSIRDKEVLEYYSTDEIKFHIIDYMDLTTYFSFYRVQQNEDGEELNKLLRKLILNKEGKPVLGPNEIFPINLTMAMLVEINEYLGKLNTKTSIQETVE